MYFVSGLALGSAKEPRHLRQTGASLSIGLFALAVAACKLVLLCFATPAHAGDDDSQDEAQADKSAGADADEGSQGKWQFTVW